MKTTTLPSILVTFSLGTIGATAEPPQHEGHSASQAMPGDHMMMAHEPHRVLAMAYHQNLAVFAKALHEQSAHAKSADVEFARAAVAEMRRSFDQMKQHHQEHMQTMSAEMRSKMSGMMRQMETHHTELNAQLTALEQEVQLSMPDAKKVSALAASINAHLDAMSKMHQGQKMKMKM